MDCRLQALSDRLQAALSPEFVAPATGFEPRWTVDRHGDWSVSIRVKPRGRRTEITLEERIASSLEEATEKLIEAKDILVQVYGK